MRGLTAPVVAVLGMLAAVGCSSSPPPVHSDAGYVTLSSIGSPRGLTYSVEGAGTGVLQGPGNRVVVRDRLSSAVVNGNRVPLSGPVVFEGEEARVPGDTAERIASLLASAPAEPPTHVAGRYTLQPPRLHGPATIVIDPGHGGKFDGCRSRSGVEEKRVTLDVARRLRDDLQRMGIRALLTRETDRELSSSYDDDLMARVHLAERSGADLFVSIHANWIKDPAISGFEVYKARNEDRLERQRRAWKGISTTRRTTFRDPAAMYDFNRQGSAALAEEVRTAMRSTSIPDRGVREAGFRVIKWAPCPAVLVEMDYLSNAGGAQRLGSSTWRQRIADALARAVMQFAAH